MNHQNGPLWFTSPLTNRGKLFNFVTDTFSYAAAPKQQPKTKNPKPPSNEFIRCRRAGNIRDIHLTTVEI